MADRVWASNYIARTGDQEFIAEVLIMRFKEAFEVAVINLKNRLRDYVDKNWYKKYEPEDYERTYETLASITYKIVRSRYRSKGQYEIEAEIFYATSPSSDDSNYIRPRPPSGGTFWARHQDTVGANTGDSYAEYIPYVIEDGFRPSYTANGKPVFVPKRKHHKYGISAMKYVVQSAQDEDYMANEIAKALRAQGWNVVLGTQMDIVSKY